MNHLKVGIRLESLGLSLRPALREAQRLGARGIQAGLGVNLDPANLLLHDFDPCASARALGNKVVHVRASDARSADAGRSAQPVPLGQGDVDWAHYLEVLTE